MQGRSIRFARGIRSRCRGLRSGNLLALLCLAAASLSGPAAAHSSRGAGDTSGLPIANLSHDQLRVVDRHRSAILALAARQVHPDLQTRTLLNFVNMQFSYCLWGLIPGSLTDEDNPFNGCSHAYLAGSKALLEHLQRSSADPSKADELASRIHSDMLLSHSAGQICSNGVAPLNTAELILPEWSGIAFNPILALLGLLAFVTMTGLLVAGRLTGSRKASSNQLSR